MMPRPKNDPQAELDAAILEMAADARATGLMADATYETITMRQLGRVEAATYAPLSGKEIRALRAKAKMSQAVFARYLQLTPGYISRLEREAVRPTGPALVLLDVVRRLGMDALVH